MGQIEIAKANAEGVFDVWGDLAVYLPPAGALPVLRCRIIIKGGDDIPPGAGARPVQAARLIDVMASEVPKPVRGGAFQLLDATGAPVGEVMTISAQPRREDALRLVWTCEVPAR
jgi:hypothetical protein